MRIPLIPSRDSANSHPSEHNAIVFDVKEETVTIEVMTYSEESNESLSRTLTFSKEQLLYALNAPSL